MLKIQQLLSIIICLVFLPNSGFSDILYHKVIKSYPLLVGTQQLFSDGKDFGFVSEKGDSAVFSISSLMFERNLCANCVCLGYPFPEGRRPHERIDQLKQDVQSNKDYFIEIILAIDYDGNPYFGIDYIELLPQKNEHILDSFLLKHFGNSNLKACKVKSNELLDSLAKTSYRNEQLSKHTKLPESFKPVNFVCSNPIMNVWYRGLWSPFEVAIPNVPIENTFVTVSNAVLKGQLGRYEVWPNLGNTCIVRVYELQDKDTIFIGSSEYRVKFIPDPKAYAGGKTGDSKISKLEINATRGVIAKMENFEVDLRMQVVSFSVITTSNSNSTEFQCIGPAFTQEVMASIQSLNSGDTVEIFNIVVQEPSGKNRTISPIRLTIK